MAGTNAPIVDRIRIIPRAKEFLDRSTGSSGEVFFSKETNTLRIYSGRTANRGGFEVVTDGSLIRNAANESIATVKYNVTVGAPQGSDTANAYYFNLEYKPELDLIVGYTYVFDQSNPTNVFYPNPTGGANNQHPLVFSSDNPNGDTDTGTAYLNGVKYILDGEEVDRTEYERGFQRATERKVLIQITIDTPDLLYYYCSNHLNMGNQLNIAMPGTGSGSASVTASDVAPEEPENGSVWFNSDTGRLYVYLVDVDSGQWVQPTIPLADSILDLNIEDGTAGQVLTTDGSGTFSFIDGNDTVYTPTTPADWNGTPPTTVGEALDRLATIVKALNGDTGA